MIRKTLTSFGGCDIFVVSRNEKKVFMELSAITWEEERFAKGQFTVENVNEYVTNSPEIWITYTNEAGEIYRTEFRGVTISWNPKSGDVWDFEAHEVKNTVLYDYLYWN
jgi:hypothetical protein